MKYLAFPGCINFNRKRETYGMCVCVYIYIYIYVYILLPYVTAEANSHLAIKEILKSYGIWMFFTVDIHGPVHHDIIYENDQQDATM